MSSLWSFYICDTQSGAKLLRVYPASGSFSRVLNGAGQGRHEFVLEPGSVMADHSLSVPWSRTLVVCCNDLPVYAGVISKRKYDRQSRSLSVTHADILTVLARRYPFGVSSYWADFAQHLPGKLVCTNLSLRSIAGLVVQAGLVGPAPIWSLPIVLPPLVESGPFSKTYENYEFTNVAGALQDIQEMDGGPDIDFRPRWSASNTLEWVMDIGIPSAPSIARDAPTGGQFEWNMAADLPGLSEITVTDDGSKQVTGQFSVGKGSEADMRVGGAGLGSGATIPALDVVQQYKTEENEATLAGFASAAVIALQAPTRQYEMKMVNGEVWSMDQMPMGSLHRLRFWDDPWMTTEDPMLRMVSFSADMGDVVTLDVQPWSA